MVHDAGCSVFWLWKRPAVWVPFLPVCLEVQDVGRCAGSMADLISESPRTLLRCLMTACAGAEGPPSMKSLTTLSSQWDVSTFISLVIAVVVVVIEIPVSGDQGILANQELRRHILSMCGTFWYLSFLLYYPPRLLTAQRHIRGGSAHH